MLARIAHELYWIGRALARAEHTARMLDGVFHADLQVRADAASGVRLSWDSMLVIMGLDLGHTPSDRDAVVSRLTLDRSDPASVVSCVAQARAGARTVRDVFSGEMWEAINTLHLGLVSGASPDTLRTGPYSLYAYVRERCGQFWGVTDRTMLRDEAYAFLQAGARIEAADMMLRMLRVALPAAESEAREDAEALALLQAVGGFQAYRRQVAHPANALPVMRFLLFAREYPGSVAASVDALLDALTAADERASTAAPVLRLRRLTADLELRSRATDGDRDVGTALATVQLELARVDADIADRYFGRSVAPPLHVA